MKYYKNKLSDRIKALVIVCIIILSGINNHLGIASNGLELQDVITIDGQIETLSETVPVSNANIRITPVSGSAIEIPEVVTGSSITINTLDTEKEFLEPIYTTANENGIFSVSDVPLVGEYIIAIDAKNYIAYEEWFKLDEVTKGLNLFLERKEEQTDFAFTITTPSAITCESYGGTYLNTVIGRDSTGTVLYEIVEGVDRASINSDTGLVTLIKSGEITVRATDSGDENYCEAIAEYKLTIEKASNDTLAFLNNNPGNIPYTDTYINIADSQKGSSNIIYSIAEDNGTEATVTTGGALSVKKPGKVVVEAIQIEEADSLYESVSCTYEITFDRIQQEELTFVTPAPAPITTEDAFQNTVIGGSSTDGKVIYEISEGSQFASIDSVTGRLTIHESGTIKVKATKKGDIYYEDIEAYYELEIIKSEDADFRFSKDIITEKYSAGLTISNPIIVGNGTGQITYSIVSGNEFGQMNENGTVEVTGVGVITICAKKSASEKYKEKEIHYELKIEKGLQDSFQFTKDMKQTLTYKDEYTIKTEGALGKVTYSIVSGQDTATVDSNTGELSLLKSGVFVVRAFVDGGMLYVNKDIDLTITVKKAQREPLIFKIPGTVEIDYGQTLYNPVLTKDGDINDNIVYYVKSGDSGAVTVEANGIVKTNYSGAIIIEALWETDDCYLRETNTYELIVNRIEQQELIFETEDKDIKEVIYGSEFKNAIHKGGSGEGKLSYHVVVGGEYVEVDKDGKLTYRDQGIGTVTIKAIKEKDSRYKETSKTYSFQLVYGEIPENPYHLEGSQIIAGGEWYSGNITIKPAEGFLISRGNKDKTVWTDNLSWEQEGSHELVVYLRNIKTKGITKAIVAKGLKLDKTVPDLDKMSITYSKSVTDHIFEAISFGFYQAPVTVSLKGEDGQSGIEKLTYSYLTIDNRSDQMEAVLIEKKNLSLSENGKKVEYIFSIPAQFHGRVSFIIEDLAGHKSEKKDTSVIVVDNISPTLSITYNTPKSIVNKNTMETESYIGENSAMFYKESVKAELFIKDSNFFESQGNNDVKITVEKESGQKITYLPYSTAGTERQINWSKYQDGYAATIYLEEEGEYRIRITYEDKSGNKMNYESSPERKSGTYEYTSALLVVDKTDPVIDIIGEGIENNQFYPTNKSVNFVIQEKYFNLKGVTINIKMTDILGTGIGSTAAYDSKLKTQGNWTRDSSNRWSCKLELDTDANYEIDFSYVDYSENKNQTTPKIAFTVDKTTPKQDEMKISYSSPVLNKVIETLTFGYYKAPVVVTLNASDSISGINVFTYGYTVDANGSKINKGNPEGTSKNEADIKYTTKKDASISFEVPAQFIGNIFFKVKDKAGNESERMTDKGIIVVDDIAPECKVIYEPLHIVDSNTMLTKEKYTDKSSSILYYDSVAKVDIEVTEANFYEDDVKVYISKNGKEKSKYKSLNWKKEEDTYRSQVKISDDGDYILTIEYMDRSGNEMKEYVSNKIVIDTIAPIITVHYNKNEIVQEAEKRMFYDKGQQVIIRVAERNFRPDDIETEVTATDISGQTVKVTNYDSYLKNRKNWTDMGEYYEAVLKYDTDANYSFTIKYEDLAFNKASDYNTDYFTVDRTEPINLDISYSENIMDTVLHAVTLGYYNKPVTVTITAEDNTSGIDYFTFSYKKEENQSGVSANLIEEKIQNANVSYSKDRRKATATFTLPKGNGVVEQFRGNVEFTAADFSGLTMEHKDKQIIVVDNISPVMDISFSDAKKTENGSIFYDDSARSVIRVTEANFYPEDVQISVEKDGVSSIINGPRWTQNKNEWTTEVNLLADVNHNGDGDYYILVKYKDRSGNTMKDYRSDRIVIDTIKPTVEIRGITEYSANKDNEIGFTITASDRNFDIITPELTLVSKKDGRYEEVSIPLGNRIGSEDGKTYRYSVRNLPDDGVYTLKCTVVDQAGNICEQVNLFDENNKIYTKDYKRNEVLLNFSVNRSGSAFTFNKETMELLGQFYVQDISKPIRIEEINVDPLMEYEVYINKEKLEKGKDYLVEESNEGWNKYSYTLDETLFKEENEYSIVVSSVDKTKAIAYSDIKEEEISFVVDRSEPDIIISGLQSEGMYRTDLQNVVVLPRDPGGKVNRVQIIKNEDNVVELSKEELETYLMENEEKIKFQLGSGMNQNILIQCTDEAGNVNIQNYERVTVSTDWYILFFANKPLVWGSGIAAGTLFGGSIFLIRAIRKRRIR